MSRGVASTIRHPSYFAKLQSLTAVQVPPDLTLTETGGQPAVIFSHAKHVLEQQPQCTDCHVKLFQMKAGMTAQKQGKLTMAAMAQGQFCGACHNGKRAFSVQDTQACATCHVRK